MVNDLSGFFAVILSLGIPITVMSWYYYSKIKEKNADVDLRKALIENKIDAETAKVIIAEKSPERKKEKKFANLTCGLSFVGMALGVLIPLLCGLDLEDVNSGFEFAACIVLGMGLGLLASFLIIWKLRKKEEEQTEEETSEEQ